MTHVQKTYSLLVASSQNLFRTNSEIPDGEQLKILAMLRCGFEPAAMGRHFFVKRQTVYNYCTKYGYNSTYREDLISRIGGLPSMELADDVWKLSATEIQEKYLYEPSALFETVVKSEGVELPEMHTHSRLKFDKSGEPEIEASSVETVMAIAEPAANLVLGENGVVDEKKLETSNSVLVNKFSRGANRILDSIIGMTDKQLGKASLSDKTRAVQVMTDKIMQLTKKDDVLGNLKGSGVNLLVLINQTIPARKKDAIYKMDGAKADAETIEAEVIEPEGEPVDEEV